jgi:hypothetical protein
MTDAHTTELLFIACAKRWLLGEMSTGDRLFMLEWLAGRVGGPITPDAVARIEPADDTTMEIVGEALRLSLGADDDGRSAFQVLERPDVAGDLLALNPSIREALGANAHHVPD